MTSGGKVRVAVVHDSPSVRAALRVALEAEPDVEVVGESDDGEGAVALVEATRPDLLLMDVVMPRVGGYEATRAVMARCPVPIVLVSSIVDPRDVGVAMEALRSGALAIVETIPSPLDPAYRFRRGAMIHLIRSLASVSVARQQHRATPIELPLPVSPVHPSRDRAAIGIAASTGGPGVLADILGALRAEDLPPVLVVQHIVSGFAEGFARWLGEVCGRSTVIAEHGLVASRGTIYVAPDDHHLELEPGGKLAVRSTPLVGMFRPSATPLFESLGRVLGNRALGIVLTGMGADGAEGARALRAAGGRLVIQDEASSVVFGMPRAARDLAGADATLSPRRMPAWIREWLAGQDPER